MLGLPRTTLELRGEPASLPHPAEHAEWAGQHRQFCAVRGPAPARSGGSTVRHGLLRAHVLTCVCVCTHTHVSDCVRSWSRARSRKAT